jgi:phosphoserine phosphatase
MLRVVLIRPGCTDLDQQRRIKGTLDIPLNSSGNSQVARAVAELAGQDIQYIYHAPCGSARQTATALAKGRRVRLKELDVLRNLDHGLWHGKLIEEVKQTQPKVYRQFQEHPENVCPPGGETLESAQQRAQKALVKLLRKHHDCVIALVVPEPLASVIRCLLLDSQIGDLWEAECDTGRWELIDVASPRTVTAN